MSDKAQNILIKIQNLHKSFPLSRSLTDFVLRRPSKAVKAVDGISLDIFENETLALVGESGCGKSSFARTIINLYKPDSGDIIFKGNNLASLDKANLKTAKRECQMIFQDPYSSLNPRMSIGDMLHEELLYHHICSKKEAQTKINELLDMVNLNKDTAERFPSEFSGGQRQRIGIARALAVNPKFLIADEAVSALDISIQAQILHLLQSLQRSHGLTILFISHDLRVVHYIADRVAVMYLGKIIELGTTDQVYTSPLHPYTKILLDSLPSVDPRKKSSVPAIEGNLPSPIDIPPGCRFSTRCPNAKPHCFNDEPGFYKVNDDHSCACHEYIA
ncbi:MAG: ABC-type dipeptide/oligopeptide/nickel transport system, ATPase component [Firmicutes bacterium]|nr:ABC-type dipeptide/oligopeptide/nickel transport system, ATPase component [Bacillota bacterium]